MEYRLFDKQHKNQMRVLIILVFVQIFVSCTNNKTIEISELDLGPDKFYCTNAFAPFSGTCKITYNNIETVKLESVYKNGILEGQTTLYYKDGTPSRKGNYVSGQHDGLWEGWFKNGKKEFEISYKSGKLNGEYVSYHQNGIIKEKGEYQNDVRTNEWVTYDWNGNEVSKMVY